jgi:nucleotide-binding universal stress UspA family protein
MYRRILVPLDGSELAEAALRHARDIAASSLAEIVLVRVPVNVLYDASAVAPPASILMYDYVRTEARTYLERVEAELKANGFKATSEVSEGLVADAILDCAERTHADLIIMSTHGRSGVARWLLGSVAEKIVRGAQVPVLIVRPPQDSHA